VNDSNFKLRSSKFKVSAKEGATGTSNFELVTSKFERCTSNFFPLWCAWALVRRAPVPAPAQDVGGRFSTGPIAWTPTIALRDVGFDTNVFDEAVVPKRDRMATLTPHVNGVIHSPHA